MNNDFLKRFRTLIILTLYRMDFRCPRPKNETWNVNKATRKYFFWYFLELAFRLYKSVDIGIVMRNPVNYE